MHACHKAGECQSQDLSPSHWLPRPALKQPVVSPWIDTRMNGVGKQDHADLSSSLSTPHMGADLCSGVALHLVPGPLGPGGLNTALGMGFFYVWGTCPSLFFKIAKNELDI